MSSRQYRPAAGGAGEPNAGTSNWGEVAGLARGQQDCTFPVVPATAQRCQQTTMMQQLHVYCLRAGVQCSHSLPIIMQSTKKVTQLKPIGPPDRQLWG